MTEEEKQILLLQIEDLNNKLTGNFMEDLYTKGEIHALMMKVNGVKPEDSHFDCIGCGA